jgi:hypothetical protein
MKNAVKISLITYIIGLVLFIAADISILLLLEGSNQLIVFAIGAVGSIIILIGIVIMFLGLDMKIKSPPQSEPAYYPSAQSVSVPVQAPSSTTPMQESRTVVEPPMPVSTQTSTAPSSDIQIPERAMPVESSEQQQNVSRIRCPKCSSVFSYVKNTVGVTRVKCPSCSTEGIIK